MTALGEELVVEGLLDLAPACTYQEHDEVGDGPAIWIVYTKPTPCGCRGALIALLCDPCWRWFTRMGIAKCRRCGHVARISECISRVEPI